MCEEKVSFLKGQFKLIGPLQNGTGPVKKKSGLVCFLMNFGQCGRPTLDRPTHSIPVSPRWPHLTSQGQGQLDRVLAMWDYPALVFLCSFPKQPHPHSETGYISFTSWGNNVASILFMSNVADNGKISFSLPIRTTLTRPGCLMVYG